MPATLRSSTTMVAYSRARAVVSLGVDPQVHTDHRVRPGRRPHGALDFDGERDEPAAGFSPDGRRHDPGVTIGDAAVKLPRGLMPG
jgi:hypothetical protein